MNDLSVWDTDIEDINRDKECLLKQIKDIAENSQNAELLWRTAKAEVYLSFFAKLNNDKIVEKQLLYASLEHARNAIEISPSSLGAIKWYCATLGCVYPYESKRKQAQFCSLIKSELDKGVIIYPDDYHLHYIYGRLSYDIASLSVFERKFVSLVTGVSVNSSYKEALNMLLKANELRPNWKPIYLWIAKTYFKLANKYEAITWLNGGLNLESKTEEDLLAHNDIIDLMQE